VSLIKTLQQNRFLLDPEQLGAGQPPLRQSADNFTVPFEMLAA
jgi:hypothetical protein